MKTLFLMLLFFSVSIFPQQKYKTMTTNQLKENIKNKTDLIILDVRTPEELIGPLGKIDGVINIPVQQLEARVNEMDKYKDKNIAVICRSGHRSGIACEILSKKGFKVYNVEGGMTKYRE